MNAFFRGGEGYGSKYNKVKDGLEQRFPGQLEIIGERQHSITGDFVVNIALIFFFFFAFFTFLPNQ